MPIKEIASAQIRVKPSVRKRLRIIAMKKGLTLAALLEFFSVANK